MRRFIATAMLACISPVCYAQALPEFRPVDSSMTLAVQPTATAPVASAPATITASPGVARNGEIIDSVGSNAIPSVPLELTTANGISYLSGGIGDEEVAQLTAQEHQFNLRLKITGMGGEFIGGAKLALRDASGNALLNMEDAGPYVYMLLNPGSYTLQIAAANGNAKTMTIKIPANGAVKDQVRL